MTLTPEMAELISEAIENRLIDVHTWMPGAVHAYVPGSPTANIELHLERILQKVDGTFIAETLPVLENVRIGTFEGGDFYLSLPLEVGSTGMTFFSEMAIDQWRSKGKVTNPSDVGRFTLSGAVFVPLLVSDIKAIPDDLTGKAVLGKRGVAQVAIETDGTIVCENLNGFSTVDGITGQVSLNDNFTVDP